MGKRCISILVCALVIAGCAAAGDEAEESRQGLFVVSTVAPITDLVQQVMGDRGEGVGLVPPGVDSHTYEPRPSDAQVLTAADLFIANGLFLEEPSIQLAEANLPAHAEIIELADRAITEDEWVFDFSFPEAEGHPNPHLWMSVVHAMTYVEGIAAALADADPDGSQGYRANADALLEELRALDEAIAEATATIPAGQRKLLTYHDSWAYFAPRYGMEIIGAIQPADFSEPSAAEVRRMVDQVRAEQIPAVFGAEEFPSPVLEAIAAETGVPYIGDLSDDELPGAPGDPEHSYIGMMVANVRIIVDALGGDPAALDRVDPAR